jgi:hypothetical protein
MGHIFLVRLPARIAAQLAVGELVELPGIPSRNPVSVW